MQPFLVILVSYLLGSIPFGFILVKLVTGKDLRGEHSGRTGGTNARRVGGRWVGAATGVLDALKGYFSVRLAMGLLPGDIWASILAPLATILGHNYSVFLLQRDEKGRWRLSGGAGGAPTLGGAMGLWLPSLFIMLPVGILVFYFIGYASVTTLSAGVMALIIFGLRARLGFSPWQYVVFGVASLTLLAWSLRPNIRRLLEGTERLHGYRARTPRAGKTV